MARVTAVLPGQAIESMRASDFDIPSAIGELIDNSIQAGAEHVALQINTKKLRLDDAKSEREFIKEIICADDGCGMAGNVGGILHNCISLGYSSRYNDRSGIGRFGVGMTYAGIRFATKIEVYSKVESGDWMYVKFDMEDPEDMNGGIDEPIKKEPPLEYQYMVKKNHGTFVIWSEFDKYRERDMYVSTYDDMKNHNSKRGKGPYRKMEVKESLGEFGLLNNWIGRTFRKFIWDGIEITLNENPVYAFDPLFIRKDKVQFPNDTPAKILLEDDIDWNGEKIHYIFTLLPEEYREEHSRGGIDFPGRYIYDNEGISILRANREVLYDHIPRLQKDNEHKIVFEQMDRWWSCEISFEPVLDEYFSVKNIKRGAIPVKDLNEVLYDKLKGIIKEAKKEVQTHWNKKSDEKKTDKGNPHATAVQIAKDTKIHGKIVAGTGKTEAEIEAKIDEIILAGLEGDEREKQKAIFKDQPFTISDDRWKGEVFIEATHINGNAVLKYNLNHPFMEEIAKLRAKMSQDDDANRLTDLIDIMLMALIQARGRLEDEEEMIVEDLWDGMMSDWGRFLKSYTRTYKDTHPVEE